MKVASVGLDGVNQDDNQPHSGGLSGFYPPY